METQIGGALGIAVLVTQLVDKVIDTKFGDMAGKWKLTIVALVSVASAITGQMAMGQTFMQALMNGTVLTALQVFVHQIISQFGEKKPVL